MNENQCIRKSVDIKLINAASNLIDENKIFLKEKSLILNLLGNEVRLGIVYLLMEYKKLCVCDISDILQISQSSISQHLRKLKDSSLITNQRDGLVIYYFIPDNLIKIITKIVKD